MQHDYILSNQSRTSMRGDLNDVLAAIVSQNSGALEPTTPYAYMLWADTGSVPPVLKQRNAANNGWITLFTLASGPADKTQANTFLAAQNFAKGASVASAATTNIWAADGNLIHVTGTTTITSLGTAPQAGATRRVIFDSTLTLTHNASTLVLPGGSNYTVAAGEVVEFVADTTSKIVMAAKSSLASTDTKIACRVYSSGTQSIPNATPTTVQLNAETYDVGGCFAAYTFTPTVADVYHVTFKAKWSAAFTGRVTLFIFQGMGTVASHTTYENGFGLSMEVSADVYLNGTTDSLTFGVQQESGTAQTLSGGSTSTFVTAHRVHAY